MSVWELAYELRVLTTGSVVGLPSTVGNLAHPAGYAPTYRRKHDQRGEVNEWPDFETPIIRSIFSRVPDKRAAVPH